MTEGPRGQFEVRVDGETVVTRGGNWFTRRLGAGYPAVEDVIVRLEQHVGTRDRP
ncbi:MAG: hypothetical protein Kow0062_10770 [Acidobacteriota bacterium]